MKATILSPILESSHLPVINMFLMIVRDSKCSNHLIQNIMVNDCLRKYINALGNISIYIMSNKIVLSERLLSSNNDEDSETIIEVMTHENI